MDPSKGNPKQALANRKKFFQKLGINPKNVAEIKQVHGNKIIVLGNIPDPNIEADGIITNRKDLYLMMKVADCMAIGLYDPKYNIIGLVHVGFRGVENGIIKKEVEAMKQNFKTDPKDLTVKINPSVGPCCYRMNLWTEAKDQLIACGVLEKNIHNPRICTYESKDYFSHRRAVDQNLKDFRFVTILGLQNAN